MYYCRKTAFDYFIQTHRYIDYRSSYLAVVDCVSEMSCGCW